MAKPTKTLSERIAERMSTRTPSPGHRNRAAFLALREEIHAALDEGWSIRVVWETLHEEKRIAFGYDAFTEYVRKLIRQAPARPIASPAALPAPIVDGRQASASAGDARASDGPKVGASELPSFKHNPHRDRKDVI